jgi:acid phosphatase type 7
VRRPAALLLGAVAVAWASSAYAARLLVPPYVQDAREDGFTIAYESDVKVNGAVVLDDGQKVVTEGQRHEARITGLKPGTRIGYRVELDGEKVAQASAASAPKGGRNLTFVVYGDTRDNPDVGHALATLIKNDHPDLVLHTGDVVKTGGDDPLWPAFFENHNVLLSEVPLYPACGNHELHGDSEGRNFNHYFVLPDEGRTRRYYTFRYGPARFIVLDGNGRHAEQTEWLKKTLEAARAEQVPHVFLLMHQPALSTGGHCGAAPVQSAWVEQYEAYPVRAVFAGHEHIYERLERRGVTYFVTGGGGAHLYEEREDCAEYDHDARRAFASAYHYLRVRVIGDDVEVSAIRTDGQPPIDTVHLSVPQPTIRSAEAPPLVPSTRSTWSRKLGPRGWRIAIAAAAMAVVVLVVRLRSRKGRS